MHLDDEAIKIARLEKDNYIQNKIVGDMSQIEFDKIEDLKTRLMKIEQFIHTQQKLIDGFTKELLWNLYHSLLEKFEEEGWKKVRSAVREDNANALRKQLALQFSENIAHIKNIIYERAEMVLTASLDHPSLSYILDNIEDLKEMICEHHDKNIYNNE